MTTGERDPAGWPVGPWLEQARGGRSLDLVAEKSGLSRATIRYYELGYRADNKQPITKPRANVLRPLARALGVSVVKAFELAGIGDQLKPEDYEENVATRELARQIDSLDPVDRQAIARIVERLLVVRGYIDPTPGDAPSVEVRGHGEDGILERVRPGVAEMENPSITDPESDPVRHDR